VTISGEITVLLKEVEAGRDGAMDDLMEAVYEDLARVARGHLNRMFQGEAQATTLEPAALVNESFLKLILQRKGFDNRGHFFAVATRVMRRVLIDYRRRQNAAKRGGADAHITLPLDEHQLAGACDPAGAIEVEALASALDKLDELSPRRAEVVKMRIVWGFDVNQIAEQLEVSPSSVERDWRFAKAWLAEEVGLPEP
jgi:RNA polymerase sigma factor (TIGR02999 family)